MAVATLGLTSAGFLNAGTINANDDDEYKTKTYEVGEISSIDANGLFSVVYEQTSGATEVAVKHLTYVELSGSGSFTCENGIKTESVRFKTAGAATVTVKDLTAKGSVEISTAGAGRIDITNVKAKELSAELNGAGSVDLQGIESKTTTAIIRGAGKITLAGKTGNATYKLNGVGVIDAESLKADNVRSDRAGIGSIRY